MPPPWKGLGVKTRLARNGRIEHLSTIGLFLTFRTVGDPAGDLEVSVFLRGLGSLTGILGFQVNPGPFPAAAGTCLAFPSLHGFCLAFFLRLPSWEEGWCFVPFGRIIS